MTNFSSKILQWYSHHKRHLPWRSDNIDPYYVVVSEFMLQQTQVPRVIEKFQEFMMKFPTISHVALASKAEVIHAWSGLGYNRRALLLHAFAQQVYQEYDGKIPNTKENLSKLPGMGPYTTGAILSFAFNLPEPAIDVNVRRIYMRHFHGKDQGLPMAKKEEQELYELIRSTIPENKSSALHNALMDFGSLICQRDKPLCPQCSLQQSCKFYPLYITEKEKALFVMEKKAEKGVYENGKFIPNRIFRGRIVEFVRKNEWKEIAFSELGMVIKKDYNESEEEWLLSLCEGLKKDRLIEYTQQNDKITIVLANN